MPDCACICWPRSTLARQHPFSSNLLLYNCPITALYTSEIEARLYPGYEYKCALTVHLICVRFDHMSRAHVSRVLLLLLQYRTAFDIGASAFRALDKLGIPPTAASVQNVLLCTHDRY